MKGLTLIEIMVALGVLAFVALSLISMLTTSMHLNKLAQERSIATALASERIQQLSSMDYQAAADYLNYQLAEETADTGPPLSFTADYGLVPDYPEYKRVVELRYDTPYAGMLTVETTVSWNHLTQGERDHVMITFLHPGLE